MTRAVLNGGAIAKMQQNLTFEGDRRVGESAEGDLPKILGH
ncbi:MAG: hypothetical protein P5702_23615 [Limnospira sp. PMC 1291.21]|uniref:Uncharacterized protein n=2 Tax=Limnospira TaxID=2596745 RepID=A0A9P1NXU9_9CYAN|nr:MULTISPECIES: hypothetical protein [Limnospira]EKD10425.1 hypothetical protein SPLC1_S080990 [Arthrospira platensis C1]MDT9287756.1 hypothetical protein [Limnospira sp. PMC 1298.21]MDY7052093.1 hypothetical protein [Limnospira fusiformis LS22]CDM93105.1 conserved protein of unknown function [Limnospira indica PCC 8005]MDT9180558.1 hypothetical protein [Limnospira sp. PMC 1238.20]